MQRPLDAGSAMLTEESSIQAAGFSLMDEAESILLSGNIQEGMDHVILGMNNIKQNFNSNVWVTFAQSTCLEHSLKDLIHQCPFTYHSFVKPRGYAGDAELIDFIYTFKSLPDGLTKFGQEILNHRIDTPVSRSVRARRDILSNIIDSVASESNYPIQILSIACGHLREAQKSKAVQANQVSKFFALDQDPLSINLINRELAGYPIETIQSSVTALVRKKLTFENLDLVYAAGLYDYLSQPFATRLTKVMFDMLRSGGRLLVANFVPDHREVGYMETFMQWYLIYRTEDELEAVTTEIPSSEIAYKRTFFEENGNIVFLELTKI
jgi:extracellular factor (EF) 3-hydroxypalmitic acid methyl ester biosynthesis protein